MIEKISIFIADIDGTLSEKGSMLHPSTKEALERLHSEGVLIGPATGRPLDHRVLSNAKKWGLSFDFDFAFGMNGGDFYDKTQGEEIQHYYRLSADTIKDIFSFMKELDINCIVYEKAYDHVLALKDEWALRMSQERNASYIEFVSVERMCEKDTGKLEFHYDEENEKEVFDVVFSHPDPRWIAVKTFKGTIEFMDPRVNKGMAVERVAEVHNTPISEVIGFGDMSNDIPLLKTAGWGVCLQNGSMDTKECADDVTELPVQEGGVGEYLKKHYWGSM